MIADLGPVVIDVDYLGRAEIQGSIGGVPKSLFQAPNTTGDALETLDRRRFSFSLADKGGISSVIDLVAGLRPSTRTEMADIVSKKTQLSMVGTLGLDERAHQLCSALKTFITNPKSISFDVTTTTPVPASRRHARGRERGDIDRTVGKGDRQRHQISGRQDDARYRIGQAGSGIDRERLKTGAGIESASQTDRARLRPCHAPARSSSRSCTRTRP